MGINGQAFVGLMLPIIPNSRRYDTVPGVGIPVIARQSDREVQQTVRKGANAESTPI